MAKILTLKRNVDFRRMYHRPSLVAPCLVTYVGKNRLGVNRIGITTGKKIGKAHLRNRARRVIREAYRIMAPSLTQGHDFVFVARTRTTACPMADVLAAMRQQLAPYVAADKKDGGTV